MMKPGLYYGGSFMDVREDDLSPDLLEDLLDCGRPGDASAAVLFVLQTYDVSGDEDDCRGYLYGYGAWDDAELEDHDANLERLVWLTGCALGEEGVAYFEKT